VNHAGGPKRKTSASPEAVLLTPATKERTTVAKVPIHFIGFLANVDRSITSLRPGEGFAIERKSSIDVVPFLRGVNRYHECYGLQTAFRILTRGSHYCVLGTDIAQFEGTANGGVGIRPRVIDNAHKRVQDKCRLLRLFKEGNIVLACSFAYYLAGTDKEVKTIACNIRENPILDTTAFALMATEVSDAESFLRTTSLPFQEKSPQLALDSFDRSYETDDAGLAFLSLMISMEVLLNPSDHELRYRVSRNAAVLLGQDSDQGRVIFKEMQGLYDKRSKLVHTGDKSNVTRDDVLRLRQYVRETIKEAMNSRMSKDQLLKTLNACGFGQRPWRENGK
jgi:hypothetical protein